MKSEMVKLHETQRQPGLLCNQSVFGSSETGQFYS